MSTDRELLELELAAKAAGYEIEWVRNSGCHYRCEEEIGREQWCPLDDDGDALRLAADVPDLNISWVFEDAWRQFPLAADQQMQRREYIRRRIVSCAAGHGRAMP